MKTFTMPGTDLVVPNVTLGLMRISEMSDDAVRGLVRTAREAGITFFDHADVYGGDHGCERRFAEAMRLTPSERADIILQTKAGIVPTDDGAYFDYSYEHIVEAANGSLAALETDYIDILLLHRPDALVQPEEVARAFDELAAAGKVRTFGVSNHTPGQIELLKRYVTQPLVANQLQLSITHSPIIAQGVANNMLGEDQSIVRDVGILDYCRLHDITVQAWSPFQAGFFDGVFLGSSDYPELNAVIDRLAAHYDVPPIAIATAWIARHPAQMQVVLGTTNADRVAGAAQGSDIPLTRAEWYELFRAAGHIVP
jgi:predicted oxidoreductase